MERIGIYGGSFSPVHSGHVKTAERFLDAVGLDKLYIMPVFAPPHKTELAEDTPGQRLDMLRLAFEDLPEYGKKIVISDYEIKKQGKSYTVYTLEHFCAPERELYFLCGTDMFFSLESWRSPERIFSLATIVCALRYESDTRDECLAFAQRYKEKYGARVLLLDNEAYPVSSTEIRAMCRQGNDIGAFVPKKVDNYIFVNNLYTANSKISDTMVEK